MVTWPSCGATSRLEWILTSGTMTSALRCTLLLLRSTCLRWAPCSCLCLCLCLCLRLCLCLCLCLRLCPQFPLLLPLRTSIALYVLPGCIAALLHAVWAMVHSGMSARLEHRNERKAWGPGALCWSGLHLHCADLVFCSVCLHIRGTDHLKCHYTYKSDMLGRCRCRQSRKCGQR